MPELYELFRALSDPTRLAIFELLRTCSQDVVIDEDGQCYCAGSASVGEVCCQMPVAQSTVSHHLRELRRAGLVCSERRGRTIMCRIVPEALARLRDFADSPRPAMESRPLGGVPAPSTVSTNGKEDHR